MSRPGFLILRSLLLTAVKGKIVRALTQVKYASSVWARLIPTTAFVFPLALKAMADVSVIQEADKLYDDYKVEDAYNLLSKYRDSKCDEYLWRLARIIYEKSKAVDNPEKKKLIFEAFDIIQEALKINDKNFSCYKWNAVLLNKKSEQEGTKQRIQEAENVKANMEKGLELNPKDASLHHMLGLWCYNVADLPWIQRSIASAVFATPPTSSYEEALESFLKAEEISPNFYCMNLAMIGRCYMKLKNKEKAIEYLSRIKGMTIKTADDKQALKESDEMLKSLK